jgi:cytochrome c553
MNKKSLLLVLSLLGIAILFISAGIYAGTTAPDVIKMENKIYDKHTKGIVEFTHKKHVADYKGTCGECHHDANGKPLDLKEGDPVQGCAECHKKPGLAPKGKDAPKLTPKQKLEYHAEAIHENCIGCHKESNKKTGTKNAPTSCAKCHPKK